MTIAQLYLLLQPLITVLGTLCLIALVAGGTLFVIAWIIRKLWIYMMAFGAAAFVLFTAALFLGA